MKDQRPLPRRQFLAFIGSAGIGGFAGCNQLRSGRSSTRTATETDPKSLTATPSLTASPTATSTLEDNQAPTILSHTATPQDMGTALAVQMTAEDNREIAYAAVQYGDSVLDAHPDRQRVSIDGQLGGIPEAEPEESGKVAYRVRDTAGNEAEAVASPDQAAPRLGVHPTTPSTAGDLVLQLDGWDNIGLHELRVILNGETTVTNDITGNKEVSRKYTLSTTTHDSLKSFAINTVEAVVEDTLKNTARKRTKQYVRKYDVMEDTRLNIAAVYIPFAGEGMHRCMASDVKTEPRVGRYGEPIPAEITSKHIDQMTGHGIGRILYDFEGWDASFENAREFLRSDLLNHVTVEPYYAKGALTESMDESWKDDVLPRDLGFLRDNFLKRDNASRYDGRPVVSTWSFVSFAVPGDLRNKLMDEFGGYEQFVQDIRSHLRVNETDPFLVAGVGTAGPALNTSDDVERLISQFDAVTTWHPGNVFKEGKPASWKKTLQEVKEDYRGTRTFTDTHDMEFIPMVFPGNDNRANQCYGGTRWIPRSQENFRRLLKLAERYQTAGRINIASWNDWLESHQIEPGTYRGTEYGTTYLQIVKSFQQSGSL